MTATASQMQREAAGGARPLSTEPASSRAWWFLGTLAVLRNPEGAPLTPTVIELTVPPGGSPPRHVHHRADDNFLLLEGEVAVRCGGRMLAARPGTYVALPAGVDHTFRVVSPGPARMLLVHADDEFLRFIAAVGTPTTELTIPPPGANDLTREELIKAGERHRFSIVGPPLDEAEADAAWTAQ
jgi:mannose-6-phosphate isomerase-like protein (cupin superfamily)